MFKDDVTATDIVYFHFAVNATTGAADDGATPLYDVRLCGGAAGDAPVASGTPTLLTHANYSPGLYEIAIDTTGYADGEYAVFITVTVSTVGPAGHVGNFRVRTANRIDSLVTDLAKIPKSDGSVIFNATCVGNIKSGLSTQAELDKVPKSDGSVTWNATALGSIQTEAQDALVVHRLDELLNADSDIDGAAPPTVGSVFHELMTKTAGSFTYDQATDSLEAIGDRGDAQWATATGFSTFDPTTDPVTLADGAHGGAASVLTLKQLDLNNGDAGGVAFRVQGTGTGNSHGVHISSVNGKGWVVDAASDAVAFNSSAARGLVSEGPTGDIVGDLTGTLARVTLCDTTTTNTDMRGTDGANTTVPPTVGAIADQVWEEAIADHSGTAGSVAASLAAAGSAGDPWLTPIPGLYLPGTAGAIVGTNLDVAVSTRAEPGADGDTLKDLSDQIDGIDTKIGTPLDLGLGATLAFNTQDIALLAQDGVNTLGTITDFGSGATVGANLFDLEAEIAAVPTAIENADALLDRDMATGVDSGSAIVRTVRQALRFLRNAWGPDGAGNISVKKENDVDESWKFVPTATPGADPITATNPEGP